MFQVRTCKQVHYNFKECYRLHFKIHSTWKLFLGLPSSHWYQVCEFWLNIHQVIVVPSWLHSHILSLTWKHATTDFYTFCSKWPSMLHFHHTYHYDLSLNGPNKAISMHDFVLMHLAKRRNVQVCKLADFALPHVPTFSCFLNFILVVLKHTKHTIKTTWNTTIWPHSHFALKLPIMPLNGFPTLGNTSPHSTHSI